VLARADQLLQGAARSRVGRAAAQIGLVLAVITALVGSSTVAMTTRLPEPSELSAAAPHRALFNPVPAAPQPVPVAAGATTLDVPRLGIHGSTLVDLGVDASGVLIPPTSTAVAGWLATSAVPGEVGPSIIAGHVDSYLGPGIFFRLDTLKPGDQVSVGRSDGVTVHFQVTNVTTVPKDQFPTDAVYGPTPGSELRLITCGGEFDHKARRYLRNVIVSAVYVGAS